MPTTPRPPTIEDLLSVKNVSDAQLSPEGDVVAFVVGDKYEKSPRHRGSAEAPDHYATHRQRPKSQIYLIPASGGEARPLTGGSGVDNSPRWSPDGQTLAFLSDRGPEGTMQVYLLPRHGGEARRLTDASGSMSWPEWSPDGRFVSFLMRDPGPPDAPPRTEGDDAIELEQDVAFLRLSVADVSTGEARAVSPEKLQIWDYDWSPDNSCFAALVSDEPFITRWYYARYVTFSVDGGEARPLYSTDRQLAGARWSPDGKWIAFIRGLYSDRGSIGGDVYVVPAEGGETRNLTPDWPASANWLEWSADSASVIVAAHEEGQISLHEAPLDGSPRRFWREAANFTGRTWPRFNRFGNALRFAAATTTLAEPAEVWLFEVGEGPERRVRPHRLTGLNSQTREYLLPDTEVIHWRSFDGLEIQGFLLKPPGYQPGKRYPTLVQIHGGPASLYGYAYPGASYGHLLALRGFVVFMPNPRGSRGWGEKFLEGNFHDQGGADLQDVLTGVDYLVAAGIADPNRLGVAGGSFGGFMTAWTITQTTRFKAAMMSCGVANWRSYHGTADIQAWDEVYYGGSPYEVGGSYDRYSPICYVDRVVTPTLIVHGEEDNLVPVSQGYEMFRALKDRGVEVEMVVYPREGHGILEWQHQIHQANRIVEWFVRKLGTNG
jgi:dipeptidyl aminopeptidase/acylaminoacyl peptidase